MLQRLYAGILTQVEDEQRHDDRDHQDQHLQAVLHLSRFVCDSAICPALSGFVLASSYSIASMSRSNSAQTVELAGTSLFYDCRERQLSFRFCALGLACVRV